MLNQVISRALQSHPHLNGRRLDVDTHEGRVVLRGEVDSYFEKQMAQEAIRRIDGVTSIENQVTVAWDRVDA